MVVGERGVNTERVADFEGFEVGFEGVPEEDRGLVCGGGGRGAGKGVGGRWGEEAEDVGLHFCMCCSHRGKCCCGDTRPPIEK